MKKIYSLALLLFTVAGYSQSSSSEIYQDIKKLGSLKKVLYIAAHPDDENTRALAYFSLGENAETAYLSLTRGDGGQNLIGSELSEDLGVLRTQELLAARSYDKSNQFFTRAVDFGYSKTAEETFKKWGKAEVLSDVVLMIRKFQPNIIITRFPPDERAGHGHHTASAVLALEAFEKAADPTFLPNQVKEYGVWQTQAVYWNTSVWWDDSIDESTANNPDVVKIDIGGYNKLLGQSYNEIGTIARSQHKCQGFGDIIERGSRIEYFKHLKGTKFKNSFFEDSSYKWANLSNNLLDNLFEKLLIQYNFTEPETATSLLLKIHKELKTLPESDFKARKIELCNNIILENLGIYAEANALDYSLAKSDKTEIQINIINRAQTPIYLNKIGEKSYQNSLLPTNEFYTQKLIIEGKTEATNPYWLVEPFNTLYTVNNKSDLLQAESKSTFMVSLEFTILNEKINFELPIIYKWKDPAFGERKRDLISTPNFTINTEENQVILQPNQEKIIRFKIHSFKDNLKTQLILNAPKGWVISPSTIPIEIENKNQDLYKEITIKTTSESERGTLTIQDKEGNKALSFTEILYDHIPTQVIFKKEEVACIVLDAKIKPGKVAYIKGAEDLVPEAISQLGFAVTVLQVEDLPNIDLNQFKSIVLGIRIYNVNPGLSNYNTQLFNYVKNGGNLVMQYNTASRFGSSTQFGPYPFEISRNRVSEEDAPVEILEPNHPIFNSPNKISQADFENWVQERGLYFAENWDKQYTPLISWHDTNEKGQKGGLIVAKYGKGQFVYTGISFFRELPNGVEGAFRLFANILSY